MAKAARLRPSGRGGALVALDGEQLRFLGWGPRDAVRLTLERAERGARVVVERDSGERRGEPLDLLSLFQKGPRTTEELVENLQGLGITEMTFHRQVRRMVQEGELIRLPCLQGERWTSLYALPKQKKHAVYMCGYIPLNYPHKNLMRVIPTALETLEARLLRPPTVDEVLMEVQENPEDERLRDVVYKLGRARGWHPPAPREIAEARARLKKLLRLHHALERGGEMAKWATPEEVREARDYAARFPRMVVGG
ncbi:MAG: hypothetical protein HY558_04475 [Euryarchaeota archaeon]|nr:hypothetical protein [Euryarchaeota archaeon]